MGSCFSSPLFFCPILFLNFNLHIDRSIYNLRYIKLTSFIYVVEFGRVHAIYAHIVMSENRLVCRVLMSDATNKKNKCDVRVESFSVIHIIQRYISLLGR